MFSGRLKLNLRPALLSQIQSHRARRQENQLPRMVQRKIAPQFSRELIEHSIIRTTDPADRDDVHRFENALDAIFVAQPERCDFKLQRTNSTENQIITNQRSEELRRTLFA